MGKRRDDVLVERAVADGVLHSLEWVRHAGEGVHLPALTPLERDNF